MHGATVEQVIESTCTVQQWNKWLNQHARCNS